MDIHEALARLEIQDVLWTYARGVDRADYETMASVYHPDGIDHHSNFDGLGTDFARHFAERHAHTSAVGQHHITNMSVKMDGENDARVESYFLAFHPHEEDGTPKFGIAAGRYLDHFHCREGKWKILDRRVVMDWTRDDFGGPPWPYSDGKPSQGLPKRLSDESYAFRGPVPGFSFNSGLDALGGVNIWRLTRPRRRRRRRRTFPATVRPMHVYHDQHFDPKAGAADAVC